MLKESYYNVWEKVNEKQYLINTYTKSVCEIDATTHRKLITFFKDPNVDGLLSKDEISALESNGFIIQEETKETEILEYLYHASKHDPFTLNIILLPTMKCNCTCDYCFQYDDKHDTLTNEGVETLKLYLKGRMSVVTKMTLTLFGGEPLLQWNNIVKLLIYIEELKKSFDFSFHLSIITNGYLLNESKIKDLLIKYHLHMIQFTIDGLNRENHDKFRKLKNGQGTYDTILKNIKLVIQTAINYNLELKVTLRLNLFNNTIRELDAFLLQFNEDEKKAIELIIRPIFNTPAFTHSNSNLLNQDTFTRRAKELGFKMLELFKTPGHYYYCEGDGGLNTIHVYPDLSVWKCGMDKNLNIDNIGFIDSKGNIAYNLNNVGEYFSNNPFSDSTCKKCKYLPVCFGGCPVTFHKTKKRECFVTSRSVVEMLT